ncbi:hypothetical protein RchiOBHm_Chr2g0101521 [Rosa chinensis]|uniref:Uncharacterized protein n=1 Tax=Rosa chinensis TaxID=74649 RepID=A0A2P6RMF7_ROSCH|nr:hypothetical protein RchiOBHm_Chr2g0101521 [Rosa chinensis]
MNSRSQEWAVERRGISGFAQLFGKRGKFSPLYVVHISGFHTVVFSLNSTCI